MKFPTESQLTEIRESFEFFDKQRKGKMTIDDLRDCFNSLGYFPTDDQLTDMIQEVIANVEVEKDQQSLDFQEYMMMLLVSLEENDAAKELNQAFAMLDYEGDGLVRLEDIYKVMVALGEEYTFQEVEKMASIREKKDVVNFDEFVAMMMHSGSNFGKKFVL